MIILKIIYFQILQGLRLLQQNMDRNKKPSDGRGISDQNVTRIIDKHMHAQAVSTRGLGPPKGPRCSSTESWYGFPGGDDPGSSRVMQQKFGWSFCLIIYKSQHDFPTLLKPHLQNHGTQIYMGIPVGKWSIDLYNKMSNLCIGTCLLEPNIYNIYQVLISPPTSNNISVISWR